MYVQNLEDGGFLSREMRSLCTLSGLDTHSTTNKGGGGSVSNPTPTHIYYTGTYFPLRRRICSVETRHKVKSGFTGFLLVVTVVEYFCTKY